VRARRLTLLLAVCGLRVSAAWAAADDAAVRRELEAHRTAATFDEADRHQAAAMALLAKSVSPALRAEVESIECQEYSFENDDADGQLRRQADAGIVRAHALGQLDAEARFQLCAANLAMAHGEFDAADARYRQALAMAQQRHSLGLEALALNLRGALASTRGMFRDAFIDLRRARDLYQAAGEPANLMATTNSLASLYARLGDYSTALEYFRQIYAAAGATMNDQDRSIVLANMATANDLLGNSDQALVLIRQSIANAERAEDPLQIAVARMKAGRLLVHAGEFDAAQGELRRAREHFSRQGDKERLATTDLYLAEALAKLGKNSESLAHVQQARSIFEANRSLLNLAEAQNLEARLLSLMGRDHEAYLVSVNARSTSAQLAKQSDAYHQVLAQVALDEREQRAENSRLRQAVQVQQAMLSERDRARRWQWFALVASVLVVIAIALWAWRQFRHGQRMRHLSLTDELTGLPNRRSILAFAASQLEHARRIRDPLTLVLLDIDHFKDVNDRYGHGVGDDVLRAVAACLAELMRHGSRVGRTGGEEFFAVLPHTRIEDALRAAERLRAGIASLRLQGPGHPTQVTASFGVVTVPPATGDLDALYLQADQALYAAKDRGRDRVVHHRDLAASTATG